MSISGISDVIGSVATLIAAVAGYKAIKKWKTDEFDRIRIESSEALYRAQVECEDAIRKMIRSESEVFFHDEDVLRVYFDCPEPLRHILSSKRVALDELAKKIEQLSKANHRAVEVEGEWVAFSSNYLRTMHRLLEIRLRQLEQYAFKYKINFPSESQMLYELDDNRLTSIMAFLNASSLYGGELGLRNNIYATISRIKKISIRQHSLVYASGFGWGIKRIRLFYLKHKVRDDVVFQDFNGESLVVSLSGAVRSKSDKGGGGKNKLSRNLNLLCREVFWSSGQFWKS